VIIKLQNVLIANYNVKGNASIVLDKAFVLNVMRKMDFI